MFGGKLLDAGGYGCVFYPSINSEGYPSSRKYVSKVLMKNDALTEYNSIQNILKVITNITDYKKYFILSDIICSPLVFKPEDLTGYEKCRVLIGENITKENINQNLDKILVINVEYGGIELFEYMKKYILSKKIITMNKKLLQLLVHGIIPMNTLKLYHCDIKSNNILMSTFPKLIDWGISITDGKVKFSSKFVFNIPFSSIFYNNGVNLTSYNDVVKFVKEKDDEYMDGIIGYVYKLIFYKNSHLPDFEIYKKARETINNIIIRYLDKIRTTMSLEEYTPIFLKNVDLWGFSVLYTEIIELLFPIYTTNVNIKNIFQSVEDLMFNTLFVNPTQPIQVEEVVKKIKMISQYLAKLHTINVQTKKRYRKITKKYTNISDKAKTLRGYI